MREYQEYQAKEKAAVEERVRRKVRGAVRTACRGMGVLFMLARIGGLVRRVLDSWKQAAWCGRQPAALSSKHSALLAGCARDGAARGAGS